MLGYGVAVPEWGSVYGPAEPTDVFQFTEVSCKGDEQNLLDCALKSELVLKDTNSLFIFRVSRCWCHLLLCRYKSALVEKAMLIDFLLKLTIQKLA